MSSGCVYAIIRALNMIDPFVSRPSFVTKAKRSHLMAIVKGESR